jgi:hypothetical protein
LRTVKDGEKLAVRMVAYRPQARPKAEAIARRSNSIRWLNFAQLLNFAPNCDRERH